MEFADAIRMVEELRRHIGDAFSVSERQEIETLYLETFGRKLRECNCKDRYSDAVVEIYSYLKKNKKMKEQCNYKLKSGVVIQFFGTPDVYTNDNLTNAVAKRYLKRFPGSIDLFEVIPENASNVVDDAENTEKTSDTKNSE